jgi:1-deoxy-D-xylulose-5-phosphate synthase
MKDGKDVAVLSIGPVGNNAALAVEGTTAAHYDMRFLKPLDERILHEVGQKFRKIVTVENGVRNGGLGSAVLEWMSDHGYQPQVVRLGLPDSFIEHGTVNQLLEIVGLDVESIRKELTPAGTEGGTL